LLDAIVKSLDLFGLRDFFMGIVGELPKKGGIVYGYESFNLYVQRGQ
jgi:hypothetical protein